MSFFSRAWDLVNCFEIPLASYQGVRLEVSNDRDRKLGYFTYLGDDLQPTYIGVN